VVSILVVDDDFAVRESLDRALRANGFDLQEHPELSRVDLGELLQQSAAAFDLLAAQKRITLSVGGEENVHGSADRHHLERVVAKLLENAVTHTPTRGVVSVRWLLDTGTASFTVADSGDGIPDSALPHVFEPLSRATQARTSATGDAG
jgi:two-component system heavy metal sensor histidine kinase CusS